MNLDQGIARDDPKVDLEGQGHRSKLEVTRPEIVILGLIVVLQVMRSRSRSHGSRSEVTLVKVKGHFGQGQANAQDIGRWAHIKVKLHFFLFLYLPCIVTLMFFLLVGS